MLNCDTRPATLGLVGAIRSFFFAETDVAVAVPPQRRSREHDVRIQELAARQAGVITAAQLRSLGVPREVTRTLTERGWLERVHRGVYRLGGAPPSPQSRRVAAALAVGERAALYARAALEIRGFVDFSSTEVDVAIAGGARSRPGIRVHDVDLGAADLVTIHGIRCCEPNRAIADFAATATSRELERAMDAVAYAGLLDVRALGELAARPHRGVRLLLRVLASHLPGTTITESELEEIYLAFVDAHEIGRGRMNVCHTLPGGRRIRIDVLYEEARLAVELDGRSAHTRAADFQRDRERDRGLTLQGLRPVRYTHRDLTAGAASTAAELRQLLRDRR